MYQNISLLEILKNDYNTNEQTKNFLGMIEQIFVSASNDINTKQNLLY